MYRVGTLRSGATIEYAAGLNVESIGGVRIVRHGGSWAGYRSQLLRVPDEHLSVIVLCNRDDADTGELAIRVADVFLLNKMGPVIADENNESTEEKPPAPVWEPRDLSRYTGTYYSPEAGAQCRLYLRNDALVLEGCAKGAVLKPGSAGEFTDENEYFTLRFPEDGAGNGGFVYDSQELRALPFTRITEQFE